MFRKSQLAINETYHVCTKSIAGYVIFNTDREFQRMHALIQYYQSADVSLRFSHFIETIGVEGFDQKFDQKKEKMVNLLRCVSCCICESCLSRR